MKKIQEEKEINYNVLNALNLMHEDLGEIYTKTSFNPFEEGFVLDEEFVIDKFLNAKQKPELETPAIVLGGEKGFNLALEHNQTNCTLALNEIENMLLDENVSPALKEELKKLKIYLLCRIELSLNYLKNAKKKKNKLELYQNICSLNYRMAQYFEGAYEETFDAHLCINAFLQFVKENSNAYKKELKDAKLKQIAQNIIKQNKLKEAESSKEDMSKAVQVKEEQAKTSVVKKVSSKKQVLAPVETKRETKNDNERNA